MGGLLRRLARRSGRRGAFLAFLTLLNWAYGYSLLTAPPVQQKAQDLLLPWTVWGWIWVATGVATASRIFARRDWIAYGLSAALMAAWALLYLDLWVTRHAPRAWVAVAVWLGFAAVILIVAGWPEPGPQIILPAEARRAP